jgi:hypothetical protein
LFYIVPNKNTTSTRLDVPSIVRMMLAPVCALVRLIVPSKLQRIFVTFFRINLLSDFDREVGSNGHRDECGFSKNTLSR